MENLFEEIVEEKERNLIATSKQLAEKGQIELDKRYIAQIEVVQDLLREWDGKKNDARYNKALILQNVNNSKITLPYPLFLLMCFMAGGLIGALIAIF